MIRSLHRYRKSVLTAILLSCVVLGIAFVGFKRADSDYFFKIQKSIDIFGRIYKEISINYVDEVDPEKFMDKKEFSSYLDLGD